MATYEIDSGITSGMILDDDWMQVRSGGTASKTTVVNNGIVHVSEGGVLLDTLVGSCTSNGGVSILNGGKAFNTVLDDGGRGYLYEGALASGVTVSSGASFSIGGNGATASAVTQDGGTVLVQSGATLTGAALNDGIVYVFGGGTILDADLRNRADIWEDAFAQGIRVLPGAFLSIRPNASAVQIQENGGYVDVQNGAKVSFASAVISGQTLSGTSATVHSGTTAVKVTVCQDGLLGMCDGGIASETIVDSCTTAGGLCVSSGGTALETAVNPGGALYVLSGGTAIGANVVAGATFQIYQGASARDLRVQPGATLSIQSGATVTDVVENGGNVYVADGANVTFAANTFQGLVLSSGYAAIHSGTTALSATVRQDGNMNVLNGGLFLSGTVSACTAAGGLCISSGGTASATNVNSGGVLYLTDGGNVLGGSILEGGSLRVMAGGKASGVAVDGGSVSVDANALFADSIVKSGTVYILDKGAASGAVLSGSGMLQVCAGASASDLTVQTGATLYIQAGATVTGVKERGGQIAIEDGANVTFAEQIISGQVIQDGVVAVHSGTTLAAPVISDDGTLCVSEGGVVSAATVNSCVYTKGLFVFSGGAALETVVNSGGEIYMYEGGYASGIELAAGGACQVRAGGSADGINVQSGSYLTICSGAIVTNVLEAGGSITVEAGASVTFADQVISGRIIKNEEISIHSGTTMASPVISDEGALHVSDGGVATSATVNSCAATKGLYVFSGGKASATNVNSGGMVYVYEGGVAAGIGLVNGAGCQIRSGGSAKDIEVQSGACLTIYSGAKVSNLLENGGTVTIEEGADVTFLEHTVSGTLLNDHTAMVHTGTTMLDTTVEETGKLVLSGGGLAVSTTLKDCDPDGGLCVYSGGTASATTANNGGFAFLFSGGTAVDNTITSGGSMTIFSGAVMKNVDIQSGGVLYMSSGSVLTGKIRICPSTLDGEKTYLFIDDNGCTIDFDISRINPSGDAEALLDDYQRIRSEPSEANYTPDFTLTVEPDQSYGTYILGIARKNPDQLPTFTVRTTDNTILGTLANDQKLMVNGIEYRLSLDINTVAMTATMMLHIGDDCTGNGPGQPITAADITALTNKDVTVTGTFDSYTVTKQYSFDAATWMDYTGGIVLQENGRVYFRGLNGYNVASPIASYTVRNIDKIAPTTPAGLKASVSGQNVSLSWDASTDNLAGVKEYTVRYAHGGQAFTVTTKNNSLELENVDFATWQWSVQAVDNVGNASAATDGEAFLVAQAAVVGAVKSDIDANGVSDVMFQYTGGFGQIGFWMNGTSTWQSTNATHPVDTWEVLGAYDMNANGKADSVLVGNVEVSGIKGAFIGYYTDAEDLDANWVNISYLTNYEGYVWKNKVGNLTGNEGKNSIVWHCAEISALGVWTDGTDSWVSLGAGYDANWTLVGCGDFAGSGKDTVVMSYLGGAKYYAVGIDSAVSELASSDLGWEVRAIGDFAGDGRDDIVAFHKETGIVAKWDDGNSASWSQLGQLDAKDWFVVGAGDYDGDKQDDLLVRQYSTGMLGYYSGGDMNKWTELGRGVDMSWTVIA